MRVTFPQPASRSPFICTTAAIWLAVSLLVASAWLATANMLTSGAGDLLSDRVRAAQSAAETVLSTLKDAETGQRGYLLTGNPVYLELYDAARSRLDGDIANLQAAPLTRPQRAQCIETLRSLAAERLQELGTTIALFQHGRAAAALDAVRSNRGKATMDAIRAEVDWLQKDAAANSDRTQVHAQRRLIWRAVLCMGAGASILLGVVAWSQERGRARVARKLDRLERYTREFELKPGLIRGLDGRITYWSSGAERLYGYPPEHAVGRISHELLRTQYPRPLAELEAVLLRDHYWQGEVTETRQDGTAVHVISTWTLHPAHAGEPAEIVQLKTDITELRSAEADLRESEMKLRLALCASGQGVWQWEFSNGIRKVIWDASCYDLFGVPRDATLDFEAWAVNLVEQDLIMTEMARALDPADPHDDYCVEHRLRHPDRGVVWISALGRALFEPDPAAPSGRRVVRIVGTARDITQSRLTEQERERSAALLRTILQTAPGPIYAKDRFGRMLLANPAALELIGKPWDRVQGRTDAEFLDDAAQGEAIMRSDRRIMEQRQTEQLEEPVNGPDGPLRVYVSTKAPMTGAGGDVVGLVGMSVDITEQKRAQDQFRMMLNELNHRVKNTLATVMGICAKTLRGLDPAGRHDLEARLLALASAHDVLTRGNWQGAALRDVVAEALVPFDGWNAARFWISGPPVSLRPNAVLTLATGLHELATNALKHGALSGESGRVEIRWETTATLLRLRWSERAGPTVTPPTGPGFGIRLIERSLAHSLCGAARIDFDNPAGVTCVIEAPLAEVVTSPDALSLPRIGDV